MNEQAEPGVTQYPQISTHHPVFDRFQPWRGEVDGGWSVNFLGVRTRDEFTAGMIGVAPSERRLVQTGLPAFDEEYLEWIDVLEAVVSREGPFTMVELGAGFGRWLMNAAAAARAIGRLPLHLVGVEAEPTHFGWMQQHFRDNNVDKKSLTLIEAPVAGQSGLVRFYIGDPSAWYGQAIDPNSPNPIRLDSLSGRLRTRLSRSPSREERRVVDLEAVSLPSILHGVGRVDLIDLDVQGVEAEVLESAEAMLSAQVKRVHIGTHGSQIEQQLRELFGRLGWTNVNDYASGAVAETPWGRVTFQDGVQTWLNPTL